MRPENLSGTLDSSQTTQLSTVTEKLKPNEATSHVKPESRSKSTQEASMFNDSARDILIFKDKRKISLKNLRAPVDSTQNQF